MGELVKTISVVAYHNNYFLKFSSTFFSPQKSPEPIKKKKKSHPQPRSLPHDA